MVNQWKLSNNTWQDLYHKKFDYCTYEYPSGYFDYLQDSSYVLDYDLVDSYTKKNDTTYWVPNYFSGINVTQIYTMGAKMAPHPKIRHIVKSGFTKPVETTFEVDSNWNFIMTFGEDPQSSGFFCPVTSKTINLSNNKSSTECTFLDLDTAIIYNLTQKVDLASYKVYQCTKENSFQSYPFERNNQQVIFLFF